MKNKGFFDRVYFVVNQIPYGKVTTYGAIANYLSSPGSARMVGWALNASKIDQLIPAHRVVNKNGLLTGKKHFEGTNLMQQLLENEKVKVFDNKIVDFENHFWDPKNHLKME